MLISFGLKSKAFLNAIATVGTSVTILMEKANAIDPYGRTLGYAFLADGTCLNEIMIIEGFAKPFNKYYCKALAEYQQVSFSARSQRKGIFGLVSNF